MATKKRAGVTPVPAGATTDRHVVHIGWGSQPEDGAETVSYAFDSPAERLAFLRGVEEGSG